MTAPLTEVFARFRTEVDDRQIKKGQASTEKFSGALKSLAAIVGVGVLGNAMKNFTGNLIDMTDEIDKSSKRLGLTTDALQEFRHAADISGVGAEKLSMALGLVQQKAFDAGRGSKEAAAIFDALGTSVKDSEGNLKSLDSLLLDVSDGFANAQNQTEKTALAMKIFGESGKDLVPFLEEGSEGINALRQEARDLGGVLSRDLIDQGARTQDALARMKMAFQGIQGNLAMHLLPAMEKLFGLVQRGVQSFQQMTKGVDFARIGMIALAAVGIPAVIAGLVALISPTTLIVAGIAAVILIVEDLISAYQGGQSVIRDFFLEHFEFDIQGLLDDLVGTWHFLVAVIKSVGPAFSLVWNMMAKGLNTITSQVADLAQSFLSLFSPISGMLKSLPGAAGKVGKSMERAADSFKKIRDSTASSGRANSQRIATASSALSNNFGTARQRDQAARLEAARSRSRQAALGEVERSNNVNQQVKIEVNGAQDPQAVGNEVQKRLQQELRRAMTAVEGS